MSVNTTTTTEAGRASATTLPTTEAPPSATEPAAEGKRCGKCGEIKARASFSRNSTTRDGLKWECKACQAEYRRANADRIAEYRRANADRNAAYQAKYRAENAERRREYNAAYQQANRARNAEREHANRRSAPELQQAEEGSTHHGSDHDDVTVRQVIIDEIKQARTTSELHQLWSVNREAFRNDDVLDAYKARGTALKKGGDRVQAEWRTQTDDAAISAIVGPAPEPYNREDLVRFNLPGRGYTFVTHGDVLAANYLERHNYSSDLISNLMEERGEIIAADISEREHEIKKHALKIIDAFNLKD